MDRVRTCDMQPLLLYCTHVSLASKFGLSHLIVQSAEDAYHAL
jgi:hypothetical protein